MDNADLPTEKFLHLSYEARWEPLRPVIVQLYTGSYGPNGKSMTMRQVADFMRDRYSFTAAVNTYTHKLRAWGVRKRTLTSEKNAIVSALGRRKRLGESTSNVTLEQGDLNKHVDKKQLKRHLRDQIRHYQVEAMAPGVLSSWNLPSAAYIASYARHSNTPSAFGTTGLTPDYINISSPAALTPGPATPEQPAGLSPSMQLVRQKNIQDRSSLLIQGRIRELLTSCGKDESIILTDYLHEFFVHSFVTAKYWGRGPPVWTKGMISALTLDAWGNTASPTPSSMPSPSASRNRPEKVTAPTQLCQWSIHVVNHPYEGIPEPQASELDEFDLGDPSSWPEWPQHNASAASLLDGMQESITHGTFSPTPPEDLPISTQLIGQSLQRDQTPLELDVWKFAIMAGNTELLWRLLDENGNKPPAGINEIHPFHIAAAFIDGGKTCCSIIDALVQILGASYSFHYNIDSHGNTILDALMVSILRSHTSVPPAHVSAGFADSKRFPGEEKDICGRWDADSPAVRRLFQGGHSRIPTEWKHPFCHTAALAICHSTIAVLGSSASPDVNASSGLFLRHCNNCGLELKLGPLHTLIVVAFYLAHRGLPGETLFGALSLLVCLLRLGAEPSLTVIMSVEDILETAESGRCHHAAMSACDLMEAVPDTLTSHWSAECQTGWMCIIQTLRLAQRGSIRKTDDESEQCSSGCPENDQAEHDLISFDFEDDESELGSSDSPSDSWSEGHDTCFLREEGAHDGWMKLPCGNPELGLLWATIQVELLTYRRIEDGAPWMSKYFSMPALRAWLEGEAAEFDTPLVQGRMMKEHSICGWFFERPFAFPAAEQVCSNHFMNMDIYKRTSFLEQPQVMFYWADIM